MQHCAGKFLVLVNNKWVTFDNFYEASRAENEILTAKVNAAKAAGKRIILTSAMAKQVEEVGSE